MRPRIRSTCCAPRSVSSRSRGRTDPSARTVPRSQAPALSWLPSTSSARAATRARRRSRSDSAAPSRRAFFRRASVRGGRCGTRTSVTWGISKRVASASGAAYGTPVRALAMIASNVACRSLSTPLPPSAWTSRPVEINQRLLCNLAAILPPCGIEVNGRGQPSSLDRAADPPGDRGEEHEQDAEEHEPGARDLGKRPQKDGEPDGRDRVVPGPHPDVAEHGPPSADGLRIVEPPELHREGDVSAAPERAEAEGHDGDGDATQEDVRVPGADGAVPAGRQGVSNHHELLLQQREETHREGEHEGNLVVEPALIHRHAPVEGIGGHREHDERDAHGREPERHEQAGVPPGRGDRDDAEQARVEVGRAVGEQMDQDNGRHQWKEEEDEHEVLQRADAAEDPDDRDDDQGHHPGVRQEERRDQKADDEDELGAWIEAVEERVASRELVEELHAYTSFIRTGAGGWRRGPRAR